ESREIGAVATRLNYEMSGMRSNIMGTARRVDRSEEGPWKEAILDIEEEWADPAVWKLIQRLSAPVTASYYLAAVDLRIDADGE
ncbi:hypothetical protein R0K19_25785, partial [Bacillus sp. SIMBA_161]